MEGEKEGEASAPACGRDWAELPRDVLMVIFLKIGLMDRLTSAGPVCRSWRKVVKEEPDLWRKIHMTSHKFGSDSVILTKLTRLLIDRSMGCLEDFSVQEFGDDSLLQYLCARTSVLKKLCLIHCYNMSDEAIAETAKTQPLLEEIQIMYGSFSEKVTEIVGKECPQLKIFKLNYSPCGFRTPKLNDDAALGIAKTMLQLTHLQLIGNRLTNEGLKAILDGCPHLEVLDISRCFNVSMDANMLACCAKLKTLRPPGKCVYKYDEDDYYDNDYEDYDATTSY